MSQFKVGDVVQLKSGGLHMTVEQVGVKSKGMENGVKCFWTEKAKQREKVFDPDMLQPAQRQAVAVAGISRRF